MGRQGGPAGFIKVQPASAKIETIFSIDNNSSLPAGCGCDWGGDVALSEWPTTTKSVVDLWIFC